MHTHSDTAVYSAQELTASLPLSGVHYTRYEIVFRKADRLGQLPCRRVRGGRYTCMYIHGAHAHSRLYSCAHTHITHVHHDLRVAEVEGGGGGGVLRPYIMLGRPGPPIKALAAFGTSAEH